MKKTMKAIAGLIISATLFPSCATMVSKTSYPVTVSSNPVGATITITDRKGIEVYKGTSPSTVILKSSAGYFAKAEYQVKISMNGYTDQIVPVTSTLNGWYLGNLLFGGPLGLLIIDPASGAMWRLENMPINVTLNKAIAETPTLKIMDIASVPENMKDNLVRIK